MNKPIQLVSELLRPQQLSDLTLPQSVIDRMQHMIDEDNVMNMLFYGEPGLGKTSAARVMMTQLGRPGCIEFNGSSVNGVDFVRNEVQRFAKSACLGAEHRKLCFIDEADYMSKPAQAALRKVIEDYSTYCRFILAVNEHSSLIPAIRSRLLSICFDIDSPKHRAHVQAKLIERYKKKLPECGINIGEQRLAELVGIYFPDMRQIATKIEFDFA